MKGSKESLTSILSLFCKGRGGLQPQEAYFARRIASCDSPLPVWGEDEGEGTFLA
jgi:hypothetical protein